MSQPAGSVRRVCNVFVVLFCMVPSFQSQQSTIRPGFSVSSALLVWTSVFPQHFHTHLSGWGSGVIRFSAVGVFYSAHRWMRKASDVVCIWCICERKTLGAAHIYDFHSLRESQRLVSNIICGYEVLVVLNRNSLNILISSCCCRSVLSKCFST